MNPHQFAAILRMQWRLTCNRFRRSGPVNWVITLILMGLAAIGSLGSFVFAAGWGWLLLAEIEPIQVMYVWDVLAGLFLFAWVIGLMTELQRSELMSLKNLLHLPVSLSGAFFLNYASSFACLTVLFFLPPMLGLCLASVIRFGGRSLVAFALLPAFLFMVTAVSYQFRGWLARIMENKRTRGTVIVIIATVFTLVLQIPMLLNMRNSTSIINGPESMQADHHRQVQELRDRHRAGEISPQEYNKELGSAQEEFRKQQDAYRQARMDSLSRTASTLNSALPIGWLPYGASRAAVGALWSPWLCVLGMSSIGAASLAMAYRSTLRSCMGIQNRLSRPGAGTRAQAREQSSLLERTIPFLTEAQSVVALTTLRTMLRAPETKMALIMPLVLACVYGSFIFSGNLDGLAEAARPWVGIGAIAMSIFGMAQLMLNVFGLDRQGFRAFVLMPTPRRDILLGKNLGIFPIAATIGLLLILLLGIVLQMQLSHIFANLLQIVVAYFLYCTISNFTSIVVPIGMAIGRIRPASMNLSVVMVQFVAIMLIAVTIIPAAFALGAELLVHSISDMDGMPVYFLLTLVELPLALWFYHTMLRLQGRHLQKREQAILEVISRVAD